jgi:hypothetical protein
MTVIDLSLAVLLRAIPACGGLVGRNCAAFRLLSSPGGESSPRLAAHPLLAYSRAEREKTWPNSNR